MKKFFVAVVLMLTLIFCVMPVFAAQNATISLSASNTTVYAGDTFTVTVKSTSVRYCIVGGYMFDFDTDVFEYVGGSALVTGFSSSGISTANDYIAGYFMNGNETVTGNLFRITLRVKDNAALGNHTISGTPSLKTEANGVQELVNCSSVGVTVTIACNHNMQQTTAAVAPGCETTGKTAVMTCANGCGLSEGGAEIPALGHDMQETAVAVAPTCTTAGKTAVKTCANG